MHKKYEPSGSRIRGILMLLLVLSMNISGKGQILKKSIPDKTVVLTFDDAPASQYSVVAPLLKKYGFGATFFVCEFPPNYNDSTLYMNWRQIRALHSMGFEIASHTRTHAQVSKLAREALIEELRYIEQRCDSLGIDKPVNFAYPGYSLSEAVLETLRQQGYIFARAGGSRAYDPMTDHPLLIPSWATDSGNKPQIMEAFERARDGKVVVLTIHGVPDIEHPWVNTPPQLFEEYLSYLHSNSFHVISLRQLEDYINVEEAKKALAPDYSKPLKN